MLLKRLAKRGFVKIVEVGPRDGLQNESAILPTMAKVELIQSLVKTGLKVVEATAFVSPKWVPQMADAAAVFSKLDLRSASFPVLVPNLKGFEEACKVNVKEIAIFGAASESFSQKNINCSIAESFVRFRPVVDAALQKGIKVRGYVSTVVGCPYEGPISPAKVAYVASELYKMGCYEISLGDTIGISTPLQFRKMIIEVSKHVPVHLLAAHCHDTYGQALANITAALDEGIRIVDSSIGGLGGCPYAKGASGNVATEDVVYMLHGLGFETGVDLDELVKVGYYTTKKLGLTYSSKAGLAIAKKSRL